MNILIIDKEVMVSEIIKMHLKTTQMISNFYYCDDADVSKEILLKERIDFVFLGLDFADSGDLGFVKWIRDLELDVDIAILSNNISTKSIKDCYRLGCLNYIIKPFNKDIIVATVKKVYNQYQYLMANDKNTQYEIDLFYSYNSNNILHKNINPKTFEIIYAKIEGYPQGFSATELSESLTISRVTVRRYLEYMVDSEILSSSLKYENIGRPRKIYRVID